MAAVDPCFGCCPGSAAGSGSDLAAADCRLCSGLCFVRFSVDPDFAAGPVCLVADPGSAVAVVSVEQF